MRHVAPLAYLLAVAAALVALDSPIPGEGYSARARRGLESLIGDVLVDPLRARRVSAVVIARNAWAGVDTIRVEGWLHPGARGAADRLHFLDDYSLPVLPDSQVRAVDFVAACRARYASLDRDSAEHLDQRDHLTDMGRIPRGLPGLDHLAVAAWLHRLGEDSLAASALASAQALARRRPDETTAADPWALLHLSLAATSYVRMVQAYAVRADDEALDEARRIQRRFRSGLREEQGATTDRLERELVRRRGDGSFGAAPVEQPPPDFDAWPVERRVRFLVEALDEVDARQWGQPGWVATGRDWRLRALVEIGEPAVPALLDVLERDERLTRSMHFWRDFVPQRTVLSVREMAHEALTSILRVHGFVPVATGDDFTSRGAVYGREQARLLRAHWMRFKGVALEDRMMQILRDHASPKMERRNAALNLGSIDRERKVPGSIAARFSKPTAAEAILAAHDAEIAALAAKPPRAGLESYEREEIEGTYVSALAMLADRRIAPQVVERAAHGAALAASWRWAHLAHVLGEPRPLASMAIRVRDGTLRLPPGEAGESELTRVLEVVQTDSVAGGDAALDALGAPDHPFASLVRRKLVQSQLSGVDEQWWFRHSFCLSVLRACLEDSSKVPHQYSLRVDDAAATHLTRLLLGVPAYVPGAADAASRRREIAAFVDRFAGRFRRLEWPVANRLFGVEGSSLFAPVLPVATRAAGAADVAAGRAVFHRPGSRGVLRMELPIFALLRDPDRTTGRLRYAMIVQAEIDSGADLLYGAFLSDGTREVSPGEIIGWRTTADVTAEAEEELAANRRRVEAAQQERRRARR